MNGCRRAGRSPSQSVSGENFPMFISRAGERPCTSSQSSPQYSQKTSRERRVRPPRPEVPKRSICPDAPGVSSVGQPPSTSLAKNSKIFKVGVERILYEKCRVLRGIECESLNLLLGAISYRLLEPFPCKVVWASIGFLQDSYGNPVGIL